MGFLSHFGVEGMNIGPGVRFGMVTISIEVYGCDCKNVG